jgi:hypothetical protein
MIADIAEAIAREATQIFAQLEGVQGGGARGLAAE